MSKTILITGATDGIGLEAAKTFAEKGHRLLIHGRSQSKLNSTQQMLKEAGASEVLAFRADFSDLKQVDQMASDVEQTGSTLDVLINNAGVLKAPETTTKDNLDIRFVVNLLAPCHLTNSLICKLSEDARILNLSSAAQAPVDLEALSSPAILDDMAAYSRSKLAFTMWTKDLAERLGGQKSVIAVNPGSLLATNMVRDGFGIAGNDVRIGADILVDCALDDKYANIQGEYYDNDSRQFSDPHPEGLDTKKIATLVTKIDELIKKLI